MRKDKILKLIEKQNLETQKLLWFDNILKNQKKELIYKVLDTWLEKYKYLFKINEKEIDYNKYLKYIEKNYNYLNKTFLKEEYIKKEYIFWLHKLIFEIFPNDSEDKIKSWKLRNEIRTIENFDDKWKLLQRDIFISSNKVEKYFFEEIENFNKNIKNNPFETIVHFFQWNLSKIHPFFNWNWRIFFILLDILLIKYNYLPLFIRQDKEKYELITSQYMIDKNFKKLELNFYNLILEKYKNYHIK